MEAYIMLDYKTGDAKMDETRPLFKKAFSECKSLSYKMFDEWAGRVEEMKKREDWEEFSKRVYDEHRAAIRFDF